MSITSFFLNNKTLGLEHKFKIILPTLDPHLGLWIFKYPFISQQILTPFLNSHCLIKNILITWIIWNLNVPLINDLTKSEFYFQEGEEVGSMISDKTRALKAKFNACLFKLTGNLNMMSYAEPKGNYQNMKQWRVICQIFWLCSILYMRL